MSRPICVHCGTAYGQRFICTETVAFPKGPKVPSYAGNLRLIRSKVWENSGGGRGRVDGVAFGPNDSIVQHFVWDGTTYGGGCPPFCTNRCAIDYARKAYEVHRLNTSED